MSSAAARAAARSAVGEVVAAARTSGQTTRHAPADERGRARGESRSATMSPRVGRGCARRPRRRRRGPLSERAACAAAPSASRSSSRSVGHSACHAPSGRSSTARAAARWSVAPSWGARIAAERISTDRPGSASAASPTIRRRVPSASSPISVRRRVATSAAILPTASIACTSASPSSVTGQRVVCQGASGAASPSSAAKAAGRAEAAAPLACRRSRRTTRAFRPRRRAGRAGATAAPAASARARTPRSQPRRAGRPSSARRAGSACGRRRRCRGARSGEAGSVALDVCGSVSAIAAGARATSMSAESRMSWLVAPRCTHALRRLAARGPSAPDQRDDRVAARHRRARRAPRGRARGRGIRSSRRRQSSAERHGVGLGGRGDPSAAYARASATSALTSASRTAASVTASSWPTLTGESSPSSTRALGRRSGTLATGAQKARNTVSFSPCSRMSWRRCPRAVRVAMSVARSSGRERGEQRVRRQRLLVLGQVDARVELVGQAAGEHDDGEERSLAIDRTRVAGPELVVTLVVRARAAEAGEACDRRGGAPRARGHRARRSSAPQISTTASGIGAPAPSKHGAAQHDRARGCAGRRPRASWRTAARRRRTGRWSGRRWARGSRGPRLGAGRGVSSVLSLGLEPGRIRTVDDDVPAVAHRELRHREVVVVGRRSGASRSFCRGWCCRSGRARTAGRPGSTSA